MSTRVSVQNSSNYFPFREVSHFVEKRRILITKLLTKRKTISRASQWGKKANKGDDVSDQENEI